MNWQDKLTSVDWWVSTAVCILKRMAMMGGAWCLVGILVGLNTAIAMDADRLGMIAHMIAGAIVLSALGSALALVGGRPLPSWIGALAGFALAPLIGEMGLVPASMHWNLAIIMGALFGATCWPWLQMTIYVGSQVKRHVPFHG